MSQDWFQWKKDDLILHLKVQPGASRNGFAQVLKDAIKLRITSPPVEGKANKNVVSFLAKSFGVSKTAVIIEAGATTKRKRVRIKRPRLDPLNLLANPGKKG